MSILSDFEDRMASAVEGLFAGAFRSPVQPVEIAKSLARAMDDGRAVGVDRVYAPTVFTVALSHSDATKLGTFLDVLARELETYLEAHADRQGYHLASRPLLKFETRDELRIGRFRVAAELATDQAGGDASSGGSVSRTSLPLAGSDPQRGIATLTVQGSDHDVALSGERTTIGRIADCEVRINDANTSRQHAVITRTEFDWLLEDLGSTNGTYLNGALISTARALTDGDVITVGTSRLVFHGPRD